MILAGLVFVPACRQAAFNEYYVESMAAEVRALEDRIYEYDSAYQSVEIENEDLRAKCDRLQAKIRALEAGKSNGSSATPRSVAPSQSYELTPGIVVENSEAFELIPNSAAVESPAPIVPKTPAAPPNIQSQPADKTKSILPEPVDPRPGVESELPPPKKSDNTTSKPRSSQTSELTEDYTMPKGMIRAAQQPNLLAPTPLPTGTVPLPSRMPPLPSGDKPSIIQGQIKLPKSSDVVLASAETARNSGTETIADRKVVEIGFHATLCRGHNFDDRLGDDGLYLVIVPRNESGQTINQEGKLKVVAQEQVDGQSNPIGVWEFSASELKEYLEPIGISQGYHLRLPWQDKPPTGRIVQVFVTYELDSDRTLVNRTEIVLSKPSNRQLTWTPR